MSKREAEYQGSKDTGLDSPMSASNPGDMPKRATAAQLANRKIRSARARAPRTAGTSAVPSAPVANPFGTLNASTAPGASTTGGTNGFSFGQSQSFPQSTVAPGSDAPNGTQSFAFGSGGGAENKSDSFPVISTPSFNFTSFNSNQEVGNPFSSAMNPPSTPTQGFTGNIFNVPPAGSQNNAQKPGQPAGANGNIFGAGGSQQAQTPFAFGSTASPGPAPSGNLFGQSTGSNMFNKPAGSTPGIFGVSQTSKPGDDAMQTSPDGKPMFNFGGTAQSSTPAFGSTTQGPSFSFGATSTSAPSTQAPASAGSPFTFTSTAPSGNLFSTTSKPLESPNFTSAAGSLFGQVSKPEEANSVTFPATPATTTAASAPALFGSTPAFAASGTTSTLFGTPAKPKEPETPLFSVAKPDEAPAKQKDAETTAASASNGTPLSFTPTSGVGSSTTNPLFSATKPTEISSTTSSLFGTSKPQENVPVTSTLFDTSKPQETTRTPSESEPIKENAPATNLPKSQSPSLFGATFPSNATNGTAKLGETPALTTAETKTQSTSTPMFGSSVSGAPFKPFGTSTNNNTTTSTSVFNAAASTPAGPMFPSPASGNTLFGAKPAEFKSNDSAPKEQDSSEPKPLFGGVPKPQENNKAPLFTPFKTSDTADKEGSTQTPTTNLFAKPAAPSQDLFAKPALPVPAESTGVGNITQAPSPLPKPKYADSGTQTKFEAKPKWAAFSPESIPDHLITEEQRENYIRMWRLGTLNSSFKAQIAQIDPQKQDIDNIVAYYVMLRTQLGIPTELTSLISPMKSDSPDDFPPKSVPPLKRKADTQNNTAIQKRRRSIEDSDAISPGASKASPLFGTTTPSPSMGRKVAGDEDGDERANDATGKRAKINGVTTNAGVDDNSSSLNQSRTSKPGVSHTLAKFASSFVAQKSPRGASPSDSEGSGEESDGNTTQDGRKTNGTTSPANGSSPTSGGGRSLFDRVQVNNEGKPVRDVQPEEDADKDDRETTEEDNPVTSLFGGSKFASSFNASGSVTPQFSFGGSGDTTPRTPLPAKSELERPATSTSVFGNLPPASASTTPPASPSAPSLFAPSAKSCATPNASSVPSPSIFANMTTQEPVSFGNTFSASNSTSPPKTTLFGAGTEQPKPLFPGPLASGSSSQPSSTASSTDASRATSPGQEEETEKLPQVDLTRGAGEENEDVLFESRSRGLKLIGGSGWVPQGVGFLRVLKNRETGRSRVLLRADPSGNIILNTLLVPQIEYSQRGSNVQFVVFKEAKPEQWTLRVKTEKLATELSTAMQENKKGGGDGKST